MTTTPSSTVHAGPDAITFRTPVRGHAFAAAPPDASPLEVGIRLLLTPEPRNPADPLALAVWTPGPRGWRIGYLERSVAARLSPRLQRGDGVTADMAGWWDAPGGWKRPVVAVTLQPKPTRSGAWGRPPRSVVRPVLNRR